MTFDQHHKELEMEMLREVYSDVHDFVVQDPTVLSVLRKYESRSQFGMKHYGQSMTDNKLSLMEWLTHLQEELQDATLYIERIMQEVEAKDGRNS